MRIYPTDDVYDVWEETYVPRNDVFFITKKIFDKYNEKFLSTLIFKPSEFWQHGEYNTIQYNNFHAYWQLNKQMDYCIVAKPGWYEQLPEAMKNELLDEQIHFKSDAVFDKSLIITNNRWLGIGKEKRRSYFKTMLDKMDENRVTDLNAPLPDFLKEVVNTFSMKQGSNCFGLTLYCLTGDKWALEEWVYFENLQSVMDILGFKSINDKVKPDDIVVWYEGETPSHSAYCVGENMFLNKNNQLIWSPIKLVSLEDIDADFEGMTYKVYRKN